MAIHHRPHNSSKGRLCHRKGLLSVCLDHCMMHPQSTILCDKILHLEDNHLGLDFEDDRMASILLLPKLKELQRLSIIR